jgi:hypothetical protein
MGLFSWMSSCGTVRDDNQPSLIQVYDGNLDDPIRRAAVEDIALIESDNKGSREAEPDEL